MRVRGQRLIAHHDLELFIAAPTWSEVEHEIRRRVDAMIQYGHVEPAERELVLQNAMTLLAENVTVVAASEYREHEAAARARVPRDPNDWPTAALARSLGCGIWTNDQDFFGCGVPVWTTETLLTHVAAGRAALEP